MKSKLKSFDEKYKLFWNKSKKIGNISHKKLIDIDDSDKSFKKTKKHNPSMKGGLVDSNTKYLTTFWKIKGTEDTYGAQIEIINDVKSGNTGSANAAAQAAAANAVRAQAEAEAANAVRAQAANAETKRLANQEEAAIAQAAANAVRAQAVAKQKLSIKAVSFTPPQNKLFNENCTLYELDKIDQEVSLSINKMNEDIFLILKENNTNLIYNLIYKKNTSFLFIDPYDYEKKTVYFSYYNDNTNANLFINIFIKFKDAETVTKLLNILQSLNIPNISVKDGFMQSPVWLINKIKKTNSQTKIQTLKELNNIQIYEKKITTSKIIDATGKNSSKQTLNYDLLTDDILGINWTVDEEFITDLGEISLYMTNKQKTERHTHIINQLRFYDYEKDNYIKEKKKDYKTFQNNNTNDKKILQWSITDEKQVTKYFYAIFENEIDAELFLNFFNQLPRKEKLKKLILKKPKTDEFNIIHTAGTIKGKGIQNNILSISINFISYEIKLIDIDNIELNIINDKTKTQKIIIEKFTDNLKGNIINFEGYTENDKSHKLNFIIKFTTNEKAKEFLIILNKKKTKKEEESVLFMDKFFKYYYYENNVTINIFNNQNNQNNQNNKIYNTIKGMLLILYKIDADELNNKYILVMIDDNENILFNKKLMNNIIITNETPQSNNFFLKISDDDYYFKIKILFESEYIKNKFLKKIEEIKKEINTIQNNNVNSQENKEIKKINKFYILNMESEKIRVGTNFYIKNENENENENQDKYKTTVYDTFISFFKNGTKKIVIKNNGNIKYIFSINQINFFSSYENENNPIKENDSPKKFKKYIYFNLETDSLETDSPNKKFIEFCFGFSDESSYDIYKETITQILGDQGQKNYEEHNKEKKTKKSKNTSTNITFYKNYFQEMNNKIEKLIEDIQLKKQTQLNIKIFNELYSKIKFILNKSDGSTPHDIVQISKFFNEQFKNEFFWKNIEFLLNFFIENRNSINSSNNSKITELKKTIDILHKELSKLLFLETNNFFFIYTQKYIDQEKKQINQNFNNDKIQNSELNYNTYYLNQINKKKIYKDKITIDDIYSGEIDIRNVILIKDVKENFYWFIINILQLYAYFSLKINKITLNVKELDKMDKDELKLQIKNELSLFKKYKTLNMKIFYKIFMELNKELNQKLASINIDNTTLNSSKLEDIKKIYIEYHSIANYSFTFNAMTNIKKTITKFNIINIISTLNNDIQTQNDLFINDRNKVYYETDIYINICFITINTYFYKPMKMFDKKKIENIPNEELKKKIYNFFNGFKQNYIYKIILLIQSIIRYFILLDCKFKIYELLGILISEEIKPFINYIQLFKKIYQKKIFNLIKYKFTQFENDIRDVPGKKSEKKIFNFQNFNNFKENMPKEIKEKEIIEKEIINLNEAEFDELLIFNQTDITNDLNSEKNPNIIFIFEICKQININFFSDNFY